MRPAWSLLFRAICLMGSLFCFYSAFALYEDRQKRIQNKLEQWWVSLDEHQKGARSFQLAFLRHLAAWVDEILNRLMGTGLFTWTSVAVSLALGQASWFFTIAVLAVWLQRSAILMLLSIAVGCLIVYLATTLRRRIGVDAYQEGYVLGQCLLGWFLAGLVLFEVPKPDPGVAARLAIFLVGPVGCVSSDILFIAATREILRSCARAASEFRLALLMLLNLVLAATLVGIPVWFLRATRFPLADLSQNHSPIKFDPLQGAFALLAASNAIDLFFCFGFALLALSLLLHRRMWPVLARPVYALQALGIGHRKVALGVLGFLLLSLGLDLDFGWDVIKHLIPHLFG